MNEVERVFGEEGSKNIRRQAPQLSPLPSTSPCSMPEWRIAAVASAVAKDGDFAMLADLIASDAAGRTSSSIDAGLRIVHARARGNDFGPAEGLLISPAAAGRLAKRFGPQHLWSPSQWETYASA